MAVIERRKQKDGTYSYRARVRKGGHEESNSFQRRRDAETWARQLEADIESGEALPAVESKRHTLAEAIERFESEKLNELKSAKDVKRLIGWWKERLGERKLFDLSAPVISKAKSELAQGIQADGTSGEVRGPATVNRYLSALSSVLSEARKEWHWINSNPVMSVSKRKEPKGRDRFLSDDERERLVVACKESPTKELLAIVWLAITTGARQGEIMGLRWPQVNLKEQKVEFVHTKNGEARTVGLNEPALGLLQQRAKARSNVATLHVGDLVFPSTTDPNKPLEIRKAFNKALRAAKIRNFRFHDLRHTAASYLAMSHATLPEIAGVLGHKTLQVVQRYAHLSKSHTVAVTKRMAEKMHKEGFGDA
jgi:integrase